MNQGLTHNEISLFQEMVIKANNQQIKIMYFHISQNIANRKTQQQLQEQQLTK